MKKLIFSILSVALIGSIFFLSSFQNKTKSMLHFNNDDYAAQWKAIDSLDNKGLPKSALEKVEIVYALAKKDKNPAQIVKATIYKNRFLALVNEEGLVLAINGMRQEMETADFPVKPILQSLSAEMYKQYYNNNSYKIRDRTATEDFTLTDIQTWDTKKFNEQTANLYKASLSDDRLKQVPMSQFEILLNGHKESLKYRPTLYDLLGHRAVDHFTNERTYLTEPVYKFYLEQPEAFNSAKDFANHNFDTKDKTSFKYEAVLLLQDLTKSHLKDKEPTALIDLELKRLGFAHHNSTLPNKEERYEKALKAIHTKYNDHPAATEAAFKIATLYSNRSSKYNPAQGGENKWSKKTAYDLCKEAIQKFPNAFGSKQCKNLLASILKKSLTLTAEKVNLPNQPILAKLEFKNVKKIHFKIVQIEFEQMKELERRNQKDLVANLNQKSIVKNWSVDLPDDGDFNAHSVELKVEDLPYGYYIIMVSDTTTFSIEGSAVAYTKLHVSDLAYLSRTDDQHKQLFFVVDRESGKPLQGVKAQLYKENYNRITRKYDYKKIGATLISDSDGKIQTSLRDAYFRVQFTKGKDELYMDNGYRNYRHNERRKETRKTTEFFLDRAIYRPGQTVYFKGLVLAKTDGDPKSRIVANEKVNVTFLDANYQQVKKLEFRTNEYGTFNGSFTAPSSGLTGRMSIKSSVNGQKNLRVEEYKRPKFEVTFNPIKESYKIDDAVTAIGQAKAFAGNNIDGGKVTYRVVRKAEFPYWRWWYWGSRPNASEMEITNGTTETDENGQFKVTFDAVPDKSISKEKQPEFSYTVYADVTDITGETRSTQTKVKVGYVALNMSIDVPEQVNSDETKSFALSSLNLNGEFEQASGYLKIEKLVQPDVIYNKRYWSKPDNQILKKSAFQTAFPNYAYDKEDEPQSWKVQRQVFEDKIDTRQRKEVKLYNINSWGQGKYKLTLTTKDKYGVDIEIIKYFTVFDLDNKTIALKEAFWHYVPKTTVEPKETVTAYLGAAKSTSYVLWETVKDGKLLSSKWLKIKGKGKAELPISEMYRGGLYYNVTSVVNNRYFHEAQYINVPWSNKKLTIEYATFRDKLLPGQDEEWQIKISGPKKDKVAAEMVATMYDASLDAFAANSWNASFYTMSYQNKAVKANSNFTSGNSRIFYNSWQPEGVGGVYRSYPDLNWFNFSFYEYAYRSRGNFGGRPGNYSLDDGVVMSSAPMDTERDLVPAAKSSAKSYAKIKSKKRVGVQENKIKEEVVEEEETAEEQDFSDVKVRTNLNETVFFFPNLQTDADGNVIIKFKMNEALTRWKFLGFAHTKDLQYAFTQNEVVTQKELMVQPNAPRFFRENDEIYFTAKVSNLSDKDLSGSAVLQLFDALTMKPIDATLQNDKATIAFSVKQGQSAPLTWKLKIPDSGVAAVTYRVIAKAGNFSDGEESTLPVLTNRMLLVETQPLPVRGGQTKDFTFAAMKKAGQSSSLKHHQMTLEFTSNPAWYAVQALPYLMEYPYECTEQVFSRYYSNSLATSVANSHPKVKSVFDSWKEMTPNALESNLSKNQELKYALLEETPWVLNAQSEAQQKKNIGLLFDLNRMSNELDRAMKKIGDRQSSNGGFSWFPGGRDSWYITQYIVEGMGHLKRLGVNEKLTGMSSTKAAGDMLAKAVKYTDERIVEYHEKLKERAAEGKIKLEDDHLSHIAVHYLYSRSFYLNQDRSSKAQEAFDYFVGQGKKYWLDKNQYSQGMIALTLHRLDDAKAAQEIVKSLKERSLNNAEMGMYWKYPNGYWWYQLPIETHSLMIEVFNEVANDAKAVDDLKVWLLKNKQTTHWKTTKSTASAVYAMLLNGDNWLMEDSDVDIYFGGKKLDQSKIQKEAGTGYFKKTFAGNEIDNSFADIKVSNPNKNPAWGALYWQYFEDFDKVKTFEDTPLKLKKQLFKEFNTDRGPEIKPVSEKVKLAPGDKLKVRIELRVDRDMEYVHLKDTRASGFEPMNVLSQYKYQGGLGYYETTKDASTNFFISYLPKGTYVFEYPLRVNHKGNFSNGVTTIQCMYAPEFTSHSEGIRVTVE